jgi:hypothetical protein
MLFKWLGALGSALAAPASPLKRARLDVTKFGIGFCPDSRRLRGAASQCCVYCGSAATVIADA